MRYKEQMTDELANDHRSSMIASVPSDMQGVGAQDEVGAVVTAIKANDLIHRDISNYLLRDIVKATIKVLDDHRAEHPGSDPAPS